MWPDNFWPDNFWPSNFWVGDEDPVITGNIILIDGTVAFNVTLDNDDYTPSRGVSKGYFTCPVQDSYGGLIRLGHNFPYEDGDTATVRWESPDGEFGELDATFDAEYARAVIPEGLLDIEGRYWKFNVVASGSRNSVPFSIRSKLLKVKTLDGLTDETA